MQIPPSANAHSDRGLKRLLTFSPVYRLFSRVIGRPETAPRLVAHCVAPAAGDRILDLGCGPGTLAELLPSSIGEYYGVDINPAYIRDASTRWAHQSSITFICGDATAAKISPGHYHIAVAIGLLHHLDDPAVERLFALAYAALRPGGRFVTWDCAFVEGQHPLARLLISMDRGRAVRRPEGYCRLAQRHFAHVESRLFHDTLRVPYTICAMTCTKETGR